METNLDNCKLHLRSLPIFSWLWWPPSITMTRKLGGMICVLQLKRRREYIETLYCFGTWLEAYEIGRICFLLFSSQLSNQPSHPCHHPSPSIFLPIPREKQKKKKKRRRIEPKTERRQKSIGRRRERWKLGGKKDEEEKRTNEMKLCKIFWWRITWYIC